MSPWLPCVATDIIGRKMVIGASWIMVLNSWILYIVITQLSENLWTCSLCNNCFVKSVFVTVGDPSLWWYGWFESGILIKIVLSCLYCLRRLHLQGSFVLVFVLIVTLILWYIKLLCHSVSLIFPPFVNYFLRKQGVPTFTRLTLY